ncbi:MAG: TonB-dependent receptor [Woeseiaceae bacterium]|nr:TonB-dependent receptor [Woeseiaceae bacterium]
MVKSTQQSAQVVSEETNLTTDIRRSAISLAVAAALPGAAMTMPNIALAQDDDMPDADAIEEIVTVGIRTSILDSVNAKRMSDTVSDVVDAGALGSLPDASIADALGRVPGVTTIRDSGQSSQLNIRGMNGDFIQTTLNGREQASTAGYSTGTRWMSFDQYPAELINQAAVYKSPKASQLEGGVAGIVELKTANPLEAPQEHNFVLNARLSQNSAAKDIGADENGYRLTGSYQGKFADDTVGFLAGVSILDQPNAFVMGRAGADDGDSIGYSGDGSAATPYIPRAFQWQGGSGTDERTGFMTALNWEPNDQFKLQVDYFRSEFDRDDERRGITASGFRNFDQDLVPNPNTVVTNPSVSNGVTTSATIAATDQNLLGDRSHPWFEARTEDQTTVAESDTYGINIEWYPTDSSTLTFDWYRSEGEKTREDRIATMHAYEFGADGPGTFQEVPGQSMTYTLNGTGIPTATFSGVDFTDPATMRLGRYERYPHLYTDEIEAFKLDFKQDVDWGAISSIEVGVRISDREFKSDRSTFQYGRREGLFNDGVIDPADICEANDSVAFDPIPCAPQSIDGFVEVQTLPGVPAHFAITDINALGVAVFGAGNFEGLDKFSDNWTFLNDTTLTEETEAAYIMANLDFDWGNVPVRGNVGIRYVRTDVKTFGLRDVGGGNGTSITDDVGVTQDNFAFNKYGPDYTDTLPSLNLAFELTENDIIRFAAAKVMGRPPVGNMTSASGSWQDQPITDPTDPNFGLSPYNVWNDGSPDLDPFRADQLDLSYEHYFDDGGAVTAAIFWKDIEALIEGPNQFRGLTPQDVEEQFGDTVSLPPGTFLNVYQTYINNDKGGYIRGIELAGTKTFDTLPGAWAGLGGTVSYSFTESETEVSSGAIIGGTTNLPLPGLSENVWSATVFFDYEAFSAHLNARYRDEFIQKIPIPGSEQPVRGLSYTTLDAQMSYAFDNGLSVVFAANNITNEDSVSEYGVSGLLGEYREFGRQLYLGVNYVY